LAAMGLCPPVTAKLQHKCQEQRSAATERPGDRECQPPLSRELADQAVKSGHVLDTRSGNAPRCRRSRAWYPIGPRLSEYSNLWL